MVKVILRQAAINDLTDIWYYTLQKWSEKQSDKYHQTIKSACNEIAKNPNIGKPYPEISKDKQLRDLKLQFGHVINVPSKTFLEEMHKHIVDWKRKNMPTGS